MKLDQAQESSAMFLLQKNLVSKMKLKNYRSKL